MASNVTCMTNFRRRQAASATQTQKATSLSASRARTILNNEDARARDALVAGGLLRVPIKEVFG